MAQPGVGAENRSQEGGTSKESVIINSKPNHLYTHDFSKKGKYMYVVHQAVNSATLQASEYIQLEIVYIYNKEDVCGFKITKVKKTSKDGAYKPTSESLFLSKATLGDIIAFADFIKSQDLKGISERRIKLGGDSLDKIDEDTKKKLITLLSSDDGQEILRTIMVDGHLTSKDIVNTGYRRAQLVEFKKLLDSEEHWMTYAQDEKSSGESLDDTKEEKVFQHFFKKNPWIFGYGLGYKFLSILQNETTIRGADVSGKGEEKLDTLAGDGQYTVLIELKKPSTKLFAKSLNRSNSWSLSTDLFLAVSQILEYKASHLTEWLDESKRYDDNGVKIQHRALDSKSILIIGRDSMFSGDDKTIESKRRTFELFRRDSRNVRIFTYDELYDRARFIVERGQK